MGAICDTERKKGDDVKFNHDGPDVSAISESQLAKLPRLERFEKKFPFYRMDVGGFMYRID